MPITSYDIYWTGVAPEADPPEYTLLTTVDASTFTHTETSVVPGTTYRFKVLATSMVGDSSLSS